MSDATDPDNPPASASQRRLCLRHLVGITERTGQHGARPLLPDRANAHRN